MEDKPEANFTHDGSPQGHRAASVDWRGVGDEAGRCTYINWPDAIEP